MHELTIILLVATFVIFGVSLKIRDIRVNVLNLTVGICSVGQIFSDSSITDSQIPFVLLPIVAILIFSAVAMMGGTRS